MKAVNKLVILICLGVLGSLGASAAPVEQSYLDTCRKEPGIPVPISVVTPSIDPEYTGTTLDVQFVVDEAGNPADLTIKSPVDATLANAVMAAVKKWKFKPAERNGMPVATRVVLPVKVVDSIDDSIFASN